MKKIILILLSTLFIVNLIIADDKDEVSKLAQDKIIKVMALLQNKELEKEKRNLLIVDELVPVIDFDRMAKISLGKKIWSQIDQTQRKEYLSLFVQQVQNSLLEKLALYKDEELRLKEVVQEKKKILVTAELVSQDDKTDILLKFAKTRKGNWKSYDLEILGISIVQTYRTQFHSLYKKGGIDLLLEKMREQGGITLQEGK